MASKPKASTTPVKSMIKQHNPKKTSIGKSRMSRPLNKHKRRGWKANRGQGVPI